jgi:hypothetical protein
MEPVQGMNIFYQVYIMFWAALCLTALIIFIRNIKDSLFNKKSYWLFILKPWKLSLFIFAIVVLTVVAPYSGDHTWDYYDMSFMGILTYITAPWSLGVIYRFIKRKSSFDQLFVAICVWMFSASWSYDIYIYFRDGQYPLTWWPNAILSSILYFCGGMLWNIEWTKGKGVYLAFEDDIWPIRSSGLVFPKIMKFTLPFIIIVVIICGIIVYGLNFK